MFGLLDKVVDFFSPTPSHAPASEDAGQSPEDAVCVQDLAVPGVAPDLSGLAATYGDEFDSGETGGYEEEWTDDYDPLGQYGREEDEYRIARLAEPVPSGTSGVDFCERPADIPLLGDGGLGLAHWWLRTPNIEAGMGPDNGSVPGEQRSADYPGMSTTINDHVGRGERDGSTCYPVEEHAGFAVDQACVEEQLELGKPTGRWLPPLNDCHTAVDEILERCRTFDGELVYGE